MVDPRIRTGVLRRTARPRMHSPPPRTERVVSCSEDFFSIWEKGSQAEIGGGGCGGTDECCFGEVELAGYELHLEICEGVGCVVYYGEGVAFVGRGGEDVDDVIVKGRPWEN